MAKKKEKLDAITALRNLREDIKTMDTHSIDGPLVLVPKADVLDLVNNWIEYCLNPNDTVLATKQ